MTNHSSKPWTEVKARLKSYEDIELIHAWCRDNCTGDYRVWGVPGTAVRRAQFESVDDALLFSLRWS